ncbi:MAG: hypothetical protein JWR72_1772 [Flavisolibacter sp.]|jgi:hypothetical protein|nr:hypothetical protein [Flavisolibacter sp.]
MPDVDNNFGQPINRTVASELFSRYMIIKQRANALLNVALNDDAGAKRFYCGGNSGTDLRSDLCFLFDKASLQRIMDKLNNGEADGVVVLPGVRDDENTMSINGRAIASEGRPTIMLFPVKYQTSDDGQIEYLISEEGEEHPGTGGSTGINAAGNQMEMPHRIASSWFY